jgi:pyridoxine 4-dehydrogenase
MMSFLPWAPIGQAREAHDAIRQVANQLHATPFQVALAWLLKRSKVILPIPGTASVEHLEENIASASLELPQSTYKKLAAVRPSYGSLRD